MKRCVRCDTINSPNARFCKSCGSTLTSAAPPPSPPPQERPFRRTHERVPVSEPQAVSQGRPFAIASIIIGAIAFPTQMLLGACCAWIVWPLVGAGVILGIIAIAMRDVPWGAAGVGINVLATIIQIMALSGLIAGLGTAGSSQMR